jgi:2-polyprenyl-3-methyl-5-hydroxy-6-metoxy-1,4-benzoquinol methylase
LNQTLNTKNHKVRAGGIMQTQKNLLEELVDAVSKINPLQKKSLLQFISQLNQEQKAINESFAQDYLSYLIDKGYTIETIASYYSWMCKDILKEQIYFKRIGEYRYKSIEETNHHVYANKEYMEKYMIGVGVSQMLWRNHHEMFSFWLRNLNAIKGDIYLEVGVGHGMFLKNAIKSGNFDQYVAVDISETSLSMAKDIISKTQLDKEVEYIHNDINLHNGHIGSVDFVTMGEVLEHVEDPASLVKRVNQLLRAGGKAYISTCANAPVLDHIYLFNNVDEIRQLFYDCGFSILDEITICNDSTPEEKWISEKANLSYAAIVEKR